LAPPDARAHLAETSGSAAAARKVNLMVGERELTTGLLAKEASFRLKIRTHRRAS
jgi:hypothetical protein